MNNTERSSTTNLVLIIMTISAVWFLLINLIMNSIWMKVEIDPILASFISSILGFIIWKKWAKKDGSDFFAEEVSRNKQIQADSKDELSDVDILLWIK